MRLIGANIGWRGNIWFMFYYSVLVFVCAIFILMETNSTIHKLGIFRYKEVYTRVLSNATFIANAILGGLLLNYIILFHLKAPFILENFLGQSSVEYGHDSLMLGCGYFVGYILSIHSHRVPFLKRNSWLLSIFISFIT